MVAHITPGASYVKRKNCTQTTGPFFLPGDAFAMSRLKPASRYGRTFIREWRKHRGLILDQLAERIGITPPSLSRIERGLQPYSQGVLESLADALNCDPGDFLTRNPLEESDDRVQALFAKLDEQEQSQVRGYIEALLQRRAA